MSELNAKAGEIEREMDTVIQNRIYPDGVSEMNDDLRRKMIKILSSCKDMAISTLRQDGWPQVNTVGFINIGQDIYFETFKTAAKAKNIERDPRVSIAIWPFYEDVTATGGLSMAAYAEKVTDKELSDEFHRLLLEKMPELEETTYNDGEKVFPDPHTVLFRLRPYVISLLDFTKSFGHADLIFVCGDDT